MEDSFIDSTAEHLRSIGLCGEVSPNHESICIMDLNHRGCCGWVVEKVMLCAINRNHGPAEPEKVAGYHMCLSCRNEFLEWVSNKRRE